MNRVSCMFVGKGIKVKIMLDDLQRQLDEHLKNEPNCLKRNGFIVLSKRNWQWLEWVFKRDELTHQINSLKTKSEVMQ